MLQRCYNERDASFGGYGGRGIGVCSAWRDAATFCRWALANGYRDDLTLDRIDNDGDYEPANCRWTTRAVQSRNGRRIRATNTSGYRGVSSVLSSRARPWRASISVSDKDVHLGCFQTAEEAARAYDTYVIRHGLEHTTNCVRVEAP